MARTGRWQLVDVDENPFLDIARIERKHTLVNVFLEAFAAMAWSQSAARGAREQTFLYALSLGVAWPGNILNNDAPFTFDIYGAERTSVKHVTRANVSFITDPVTLFKGVAVVVRIAKMLL